MVSLLQKYKPKSFIDLRGQPAIVDELRTFVRDPYSCAMLFFGPPGVGKSSSAEVLARELGCDLEDEWSGSFLTIASGRQRLGELENVLDMLRYSPRSGSGWRVVKIDEADTMPSRTEEAWLDVLDNPPDKCVFVFTSNHPDKLSGRFIDRCSLKATFQPSPSSVERLVADVWAKEMGTQRPPSLKELGLDGQSFREALATLTRYINRHRRACRV